MPKQIVDRMILRAETVARRSSMGLWDLTLAAELSEAFGNFDCRVAAGAAVDQCAQEKLSAIAAGKDDRSAMSRLRAAIRVMGAARDGAEGLPHEAHRVASDHKRAERHAHLRGQGRLVRHATLGLGRVVMDEAISGESARQLIVYFASGKRPIRSDHVSTVAEGTAWLS